MRNGRKEVNMNYPLINTERYQITIATENDACWLHALLNDKDVYKYIEGIRPFAETVRRTARFIEDMLYAYNNGNGFLWKITYKEKPIGFICTFDFEETPSVCYGIDKAYRNKGVMTETMKSVFYYQTQFSKKSFLFRISKENVASLSVHNKIASTFNTVLHIDSNNN